MVLYAVRLKEGDRVKLAPGADAGDKCLQKPTDVGTIIKDDNDSTPFKVRCERSGDTSWYMVGKLYLAAEVPGGDDDDDDDAAAAAAAGRFFFPRFSRFLDIYREIYKRPKPRKRAL